MTITVAGTKKEYEDGLTVDMTAPQAILYFR